MKRGKDKENSFYGFQTFKEWPKTLFIQNFSTEIAYIWLNISFAWYILVLVHAFLEAIERQNHVT